MANKVELTASQLASLDLLIAKKQENVDFLTDIANDVAHVAEAVVATAAAVAAVTGAHNLADNSVKSALTVAKNAKLDDLIALRNNAIVK